MGGRLCKSPPWIPFLFTAILFPMGKRKVDAHYFETVQRPPPDAPDPAVYRKRPQL